MFDAGRHTFSFLFTILALFPGSSLAERQAATDPADVLAYDNGEYGSVPMETLRSVDFNVTRVSKRVWSPECDKPDHYYFLNTYEYGVPVQIHTGPQIIDNSGTTVWFGEGYRGAWTVSAITYKGEQYLSFWVGDPNIRGKGHGEGNFILLDKHYEVFTTISAVGATPADMHEFGMTSNDTALLIVCPTAHRTDLDLLGIQDTNGYISDCSFQELDISTNPATLLFSWKASEHVSLAESWIRPDPAVGYNTTDQAIDWIHPNSVEKDRHGNYLVSARHTSTVYYISGVDGHILWRLGGSHTDFKDADGGNATDFMRQHHARWRDDDERDVLSLFDNGPSTWIRPSRGLQLRLDHEHNTVSLDMSLTHPLGYWSESQGSLSQLEDGNWLLGWGNAGAITEWNENGTSVLCDLQLSALHDKYSVYQGGYSPGSVWTYRVQRERWVGLPKRAPDVLVDESAVVSGRVGLGRSRACDPDDYDTPCWDEAWNNTHDAVARSTNTASPTSIDDSEYGMCTPDSHDTPCWEKVLDSNGANSNDDEILYLSTETNTPGPAKLFVSWNGATEVKSYRIWTSPELDLTTPEHAWPWREAAAFEKRGFETEANVGVVTHDNVFKVEGYDARGASLGIWMYVRGKEREGNSTPLVALDAVFDGRSGRVRVEGEGEVEERLRLEGRLSMQSFSLAYLVVAVALCGGCAAWMFRRGRGLWRIKRKLGWSGAEIEGQTEREREAEHFL